MAKDELLHVPLVLAAVREIEARTALVESIRCSPAPGIASLDLSTRRLEFSDEEYLELGRVLKLATRGLEP